MNSNVRVNDDGSVFFFNQDKQIQPNDIFGVFVTTPNGTPTRLVLHRMVDTCEVLKITAHCFRESPSDRVCIVGDLPDSEYLTLLNFMKTQGYCSQDNNLLCVSNSARDLFADY